VIDDKLVKEMLTEAFYTKDSIFDFDGIIRLGHRVEEEDFNTTDLIAKDAPSLDELFKIAGRTYEKEFSLPEYKIGDTIKIRRNPLETAMLKNRREIVNAKRQMAAKNP
jgi:hypothetical protein